MFLGTGTTTLLALVLGWGLCLVAIAFTLSTLLSSRQLATVTGYAVALFGNIASFSIATVVYGRGCHSSAQRKDFYRIRWVVSVPCNKIDGS